MLRLARLPPLREWRYRRECQRLFREDKAPEIDSRRFAFLTKAILLFAD
jgi:hypothetical protein